MWSMTSSIYDLIALNFNDGNGKISKLYGYTYTGELVLIIIIWWLSLNDVTNQFSLGAFLVLSILAPVMFININRDMYTSESAKFIVTFVSLIVYYFIFEIIYELTYFSVQFVTKHYTSKSKCIAFVKVYAIVLLIFFSSIVTSWALLRRNNWDANYIQNSIIVAIFGASLFLNLLSFLLTLDFVVETFRLKNEKIDEFWDKVLKKYNCHNWSFLQKPFKRIKVYNLFHFELSQLFQLKLHSNFVLRHIK